MIRRQILMDIVTLKYFMEIASGKTFWEVAETHNISQSSVSKSIHRLEEELNVQLFNRSKRTASLTPAGSMFYEALKVIEPQFRKALNDLSAYSRRKTLKICISPGLEFTKFNFMTMTQDFFSENNIQPVLVSSNGPRESFSDLAAGNIDIMLCHRYSFSDDYSYNVIIREDPLYVITSLEHPFADRDSVSLDEIADEPIIMRSRIMHEVLEESCEKAGIPLPARLTFYDVPAETMPRNQILDQVAVGEDITLYFESDLSIFNLKKLHAVRLTGCPDFPLILAHSKRRRMDSMFEACWEYVLGIFSLSNIW